jgi:hypothetical protein
VVDIREGYGPIFRGAPAHGQVAAGDQHQVSGKRIVVDFSLGVDRRLEAMVEPEVVEGSGNAEKLGRRAGNVQPIRRSQRVDGRTVRRINLKVSPLAAPGSARSS